LYARFASLKTAVSCAGSTKAVSRRRRAGMLFRRNMMERCGFGFVLIRMGSQNINAVRQGSQKKYTRHLTKQLRDNR
jgi:hypothetical protein